MQPNNQTAFFRRSYKWNRSESSRGIAGSSYRDAIRIDLKGREGSSDPSERNHAITCSFVGRVTGLCTTFCNRAGLQVELNLNPVALIAFTSRVGPWLGREIAKKPTLLTSLISSLQIGGKFIGSKTADIVAWAKSNPGNAVMLASTLASLGYGVSELFGNSKDGDVIEFQKGLTDVAAKAAARIDLLGAKSEEESYGSASAEQAVKDQLSIEVLSWARSFCGTIPAAIEMHRKLQAFVEMPLPEVRRGFSVYKLQ